MREITLASMYFPPDKNGMATYAENLYKFLNSKGWKIRLITNKRAGKEKSANCYQVDVPKVKLDEWKASPVLKDPRLYSLKFSKGVFDVLTGKERIVHYLACLDDYILLYSALAKKIKENGGLVIISIGGGGAEAPKELEPLRAEMLNQADLTTVFSYQLKKALIKSGVAPSKILFSPPPVDLNKFGFKVPTGKEVLNVLYAGRIDRKKGIFDILKIAKELKNRPFKFLIIGEGQDKGALKKELESTKLTNVSVLRAVNHKQMPKIYRRSDILLLPTHQDEFPAVILEAFATGLSCVATSVGEIPNVITDGKNGYLFSPGDVKGAIKSLLLLTDVRKRKEFAEKNKKLVKEYSTEKVFGRLINIYEQAISL